MIGEYKINNIYNEDSYEAIKKIPDKSVDCVYTDVPYLMPNSRGDGGGFMGERVNRVSRTELNTMNNGLDYSILEEFVRISKTLNIFIWCNKFMVKDILSYFIDEVGVVKYEIMFWGKSNPIPMTNNVWLSDTEYCLWFGEKETKLNDGYDLKSKYHISPINKKDKELYQHPTIKPLDLVKRHIEHTTQPGDLVADFFMGSGTTAVAAKETGRNFIGFEIDEKWHKIAVDRANGINASGQTSIFTDFDSLGGGE